MYAPYQIYSTNIDTISTRASIDDRMSRGKYRYFQVSEYNRSDRNTVVSSSSIPIYLFVRGVPPLYREENIDALLAISRYRWRSLPGISGPWVLANGRPRRRRRRCRCFCQARRSLRGSHVNVRRAARKRVRRVSAKRGARSWRGDTRRRDVRGRKRGATNGTVSSRWADEDPHREGGGSTLRKTIYVVR